MQDSFHMLEAEAGSLFAATIIFVVFFLVARVVHVRQLVALAFATMPLLLTWAALGLTPTGI